MHLLTPEACGSSASAARWPPRAAAQWVARRAWCRSRTRRLSCTTSMPVPTTIMYATSARCSHPNPRPNPAARTSIPCRPSFSHSVRLCVFEQVCESLHASCCQLQQKLHRCTCSGERRAATAASGVDATRPPAHPLFIESLPTIIARQCAALDYREAALGQECQDAARGCTCSEPRVRTHPGLAHPGFLAAALRQPQGTALAPLDALWSADVAAAETQMRSFATACYLAPRDRLHALQTRSTLERCAVSVAALTRHERVLAARLALAQALGGRVDDTEAFP